MDRSAERTWHSSSFWFSKRLQNIIYHLAFSPAWLKDFSWSFRMEDWSWKTAGAKIRPLPRQAIRPVINSTKQHDDQVTVDVFVHSIVLTRTCYACGWLRLPEGLLMTQWSLWETSAYILPPIDENPPWCYSKFDSIIYDFVVGTVLVSPSDIVRSHIPYLLVNDGKPKRCRALSSFTFGKNGRILLIWSRSEYNNDKSSFRSLTQIPKLLSNSLKQSKHWPSTWSEAGHAAKTISTKNRTFWWKLEAGGETWDFGESESCDVSCKTLPWAIQPVN